MGTAQGVVAAIALVANGFSGIAALFRLPAILPGMAKAAVPQSWLIFPIGTAKTAGALGLMAGPVWPPVGWAAAAGLVLFFALGFGLYATLLAGIGSLGTRYRETQQISGGVSILAIFPLLLITVMLE